MRAPDLDLRLLRYFLAVADHLHFRRAADALAISQPVLSRQIRMLERLMGGDLLIRTPRGVTLTPSGSVLHREARRILREASTAVDLTRAAGRGEGGTLAIGFVESVGISILPDLARTYAAAHPHVRLRLETHFHDELIARLHSGDLDVAIGRSPESHKGLGCHPAAREDIVHLAVAADHALADREFVTIPDIGEEGFILWPAVLDSAQRAAVMVAFHNAGVRLRVAQEASSLLTILGLVAAGVGVSLLAPQYKVLRWPGVMFIPVRGLTSTLQVVWREDRMTPLLQGFLAVARERLAV